MTVDNPLVESAPVEQTDQNLVLRARAGDRRALEDLIERHQAWIYNIALRMLFHPQDAEDATQEILIKVVTRLASFEGRSSFRTWLHRIVANHLLNVKRGREELKVTTFSAYGDGLDNTPDLDPPDPKGCRLTITCSSPKRCLPALLECCFAWIVSSAWLTSLVPSWVSATPSPPQYRKSRQRTFANGWLALGATCGTS
jgi:hypothetical protein